MWRWLRKDKSEPAAVSGQLHGAPPRQRTKTYSAEDGFVYQYAYKGWRETAEGKGYVFAVTRTGTDAAHAVMELCNGDVQGISLNAGREISAQEQYAVAKLALFEWFDSEKNGETTVRVTSAKMREFLQRLGRL